MNRMRWTFFPWLYDLVMGAAERGPLRRWRRSTVRPAHGLVLEIGAGTGLNFPHYAPGVTVVATDPNLGMLERARSRTAASAAVVVLVAADAEALPFRDGLFDTAVIGLALCTIARPERALAEVQRTLLPGGSLRLLEHVRARNRAIARLQLSRQMTDHMRQMPAGQMSEQHRTMQQMGEHLSGMTERMKGFSEQMRAFMRDESMMGDRGMQGDMDEMQKHMGAMTTDLEKMLQSMERVSKRMGATARKP